MAEAPQRAENCVRRLEFTGWFWFGGGPGRRFSPLHPLQSFGVHGFLSCRDGSSADHHVGQSEERVELMSVLGQSAIPHFPVAKEILHDVEGMLHERSH